MFKKDTFLAGIVAIPYATDNYASDFTKDVVKRSFRRSRFIGVE